MSDNSLNLYLQSLPTIRQSLDLCGAGAFYFGVANLAPKIALGKVEMTLHPSGDALIVMSQGKSRVIPLSDRAAYWGVLNNLLEAGMPLAQVPWWAADALRHHYTVAKQHEEYLIKTETLQVMPGGRLANVRNLMNRARRLCSVEEMPLAEAYLAEYLTLNKVWYRQNAEAKFRTYDKTSIDWLLENFGAVQSVAQDLVCLGIRHEGKLLNMTVASMLSANSWSAYTERFDRDAQIEGANWLAWSVLADRFKDVPWENDGTADTTELRKNKGKLLDHKVPFFTVSK